MIYNMENYFHNSHFSPMLFLYYFSIVVIVNFWTLIFGQTDWAYSEVSGFSFGGITVALRASEFEFLGCLQ